MHIIYSLGFFAIAFYMKVNCTLFGKVADQVIAADWKSVGVGSLPTLSTELKCVYEADGMCYGLNEWTFERHAAGVKGRPAMLVRIQLYTQK